MNIKYLMSHKLAAHKIKSHNETVPCSVDGAKCSKDFFLLKI